MIFLVLSGKMVALPRKCDSFALNGKWKMIFLKEYMEIWHFLYMRIGAANVVLRPFSKINEIQSSPAKYT